MKLKPIPQTFSFQLFDWHADRDHSPEWGSGHRAGGFNTTAIYWECSCAGDFWWPSTVEECPICRTRQDDSPHARMWAMVDRGFLPPEVLDFLSSQPHHHEFKNGACWCQQPDPQFNPL